jgi:hypothetical protein
LLSFYIQQPSSTTYFNLKMERSKKPAALSASKPAEPSAAVDISEEKGTVSATLPSGDSVEVGNSNPQDKRVTGTETALDKS